MLHRLLCASACALTACSPEGPAFPEGFLFGAAIAPYQTEGGLDKTDWAQWEVRCSTCSHQRADDGPGFWERYAGDLDAAQALHHNTLRLGIEWARIFPSEDRFPDQPDEAAVARYREILTAARARGIAPLVTLQHYSLPVWVHELSDPARPGWEDPAIVARFAAWAGFCGRRFGDLVDLWQTINEPVPGIVAGWVGGVFPPGKSFATTAGLKALGHMRSAHAAAYDALYASDSRDADGDGKPVLVSFAQNSGPFLPLSDQPAAQATAATLARLWNDHFLDAVTRGDVDGDFDGSLDGPADVRGDATLAGRLDFIGLNYYYEGHPAPSDYSDGATIYGRLQVALNTLDVACGARSAKVSLMGFSRGSAMTFEVLARDLAGPARELPLAAPEHDARRERAVGDARHPAHRKV